jgi:hypothetical protein
MKITLFGTALALVAFAPAMAWADCDFHDKASMASSKPADKAELAQAQAPAKAPAPVVAKTSVAKHVKQTSDKPTTSAKAADGSTVVAKNN